MIYNVGDRYRCIASPYNWSCVGEIFTMTHTETKCLTTIPPQYSTSIHMYCAATKQEWVLDEEDFNKYFEPEEALIKPEAIVLPERENISMNKQYESDDRMVSHPDHYQSSNGVECIEAIKAATENLNGIFATDTGNIIKYAWRWNDKGTPIQDVKKIIWYATHLLNELEAIQSSVIED